jgi:hypothetical protein
MCPCSLRFLPVQAIESEFLENLTDDDALKHLIFCDSSVPHHPLARFAWGNKQSLLRGPVKGDLTSVHSASNVDAAHGAGVSPHIQRVLSRLRQWFDEHYRAKPGVCGGGDELQLLPARRMQLVVRANGAFLCSGGDAGCGLADPSASLDVIEGVVRAALRPLTAAWDRVLREQRKVQRQKKQATKVRHGSKTGIDSSLLVASPALPPSDDRYIDAVDALYAALGSAATESGVRMTPIESWGDVIRCADMGRSRVAGSIAAQAVGTSCRTGQPSNPLRVWKSVDLDAAHDTIDQRGHPLVCFSVPVEPIHTLALTWALPPLQHWSIDRPASTVAHLLGHEARGSIIHFLRMKSWATALEAGLLWNVGEDMSSVCALIRMTITLTPQGLQEWKQVVSVVQSYILHVLCGGTHPCFDAIPRGIDPCAQGTNAFLESLLPSKPVLDARSESSTKTKKKSRRGDDASHEKGLRTFGAPLSAVASAVEAAGPWWPSSSSEIPASAMHSLVIAASALAPWHLESARIEAAEYDFSEDRDDPVEMCTSLSVAMMLGACDGDILRAWRLMAPKLCPPAVAVVLAHLYPSNCRIDISSPLAAAVIVAAKSTCASDRGGFSDCDAAGASSTSADSLMPVALMKQLSVFEKANLYHFTEQHTQVQYALAPIDLAVLRCWRDPLYEPLLHLPRHNPFVPSSLSLPDAPSNSAADMRAELPASQLHCAWFAGPSGAEVSDIDNSAVLGRLWHKKDVKFNVPRTVVDVFISLPALSCVMCSHVEKHEVSCFDSRPLPPSLVTPTLSSYPCELKADIGRVPIDAATLLRAKLAAIAAGVPASGGGAPPCPSLTTATVLAHLFVSAACEDLIETLYFAGEYATTFFQNAICVFRTSACVFCAISELAGLHAELEAADGGIFISVDGFSEHLPLLLDLIMRTLCGNVDEVLGSANGLPRPLQSLDASMERLLHSFRSTCAMCNVNNECRLAGHLSLYVFPCIYFRS